MPDRTPPSGGVRGDLPEQIRLITQDRHIGYRRTTISEHHDQVDRYSARVVPATALPQRPQRVA